MGEKPLPRHDKTRYPSDAVLDMFERYGQHPTFQVSFDGLGHHDWLRGVEGAEESVDAAFRLLQRRGVPASAAMCIHRENRDSLAPTARYLASLSVRGLRVNAPQKIGSWKRNAEDYALTNDEVWETYRAYIPQFFADGMPLDIELEGCFSCKRGSSDYKVPYAERGTNDLDWSQIPYCESIRYNMHIGPNGRVYPCMAFSCSVLTEAFPSALEQPLGEITLAGAYREVVDTKVSDLLERNPECAACEHLPGCMGGCLVEGMTDEGDYLVPDGRCYHFNRHVGADAVRKVADAALA